MDFPEDFTQHPSPAQIYEVATNYTALLRAFFRHPRFPDKSATRHPGFLWVCDFVQKTYTDFIYPFLPPHVELRCKVLSHPTMYANPQYDSLWDLTWDAEAKAFKDARGARGPEFPTLPQEVAQELITDIFTRSLMARKVIFENDTDSLARDFIGGRPLDFGEEVRAAAEKLPKSPVEY